MRAISSTLNSAIQAQTRHPYVTLTAEDHINHLGQGLALSTSDQLNAACVADDGSIIRVSLTRDNSGMHAFTQSLQWQRITDLTSSSQWQMWTTFGGGSGNMAQDCGCAISNNGGVLRVFAQQGSGSNALFTWSSSDNGQTWSSSPVTVLSPPGGALLKGIASAGNSDVFFIYDVSGGEALGCAFLAGSWSSLRTWTQAPFAQVGGASGLAVVWSAANTLYTLIYSDQYALHACTTNSNGTAWTLLPDVAPSTNQNILRLAPQLTICDGLYHLTCVEADNGNYTGTTYRYPRVRQSYDLLHWSSGFLLHDLTTYYGACYLKTTPPGQSRASYVAATTQKVELGPAFQSSDSSQYCNLTTRVLEYRRADELGKPSTISLVLDNSASSLTPYVANYGMSYAPMGLNTTLVLGEGYYTGSPPVTPEAVTVAKYHIRQIVFERAPGRNQLVIEAQDLTYLLDTTNRYQMTYINQTLSWMLAEICARAGFFNIVLPTTAQMSMPVVTFVLHAGQTYRRAIDELCRIGWLEYFLDQNETLQFRELAPTDPVVWTYAPEIETLTLGSANLRANHVIVSGKPPNGSYVGAITTGEAYDDMHMHVTGSEYVLTESDPKLLSAAVCSSKAAFLLAQEQRDQVAHSITLPHNPALQLLDPLQLNDQPQPAGTGLSSTARIYKAQVHYLPEHSIYSMTLDLEGL